MNKQFHALSGGQLPFFLQASKMIRTTGHPLIECAKVQGTIGSLTSFCSDAPPRLYIARYVADSEVLGRKHEKCDFEALRVL